MKAHIQNYALQLYENLKDLGVARWLSQGDKTET
jgi:hypothetical protein